MKIEIWKPVVGYEGIYSVSDMGRVRRDLGYFTGAGINHRFVPGGRILRQARTEDNPYPIVSLAWPPGSKRTAQVHKLVAQAFLGKCPTGFQVNHKNTVKTDPRLSNLEYITCSQNIRHAIASGLFAVGERHYNAKLTDEQVKEMRFRASRGVPVKQLAHEAGLNPATVYGVVAKKTWTHI